MPFGQWRKVLTITAQQRFCTDRGRRQNWPCPKPQRKAMRPNMGRPSAVIVFRTLWPRWTYVIYLEKLRDLSLRQISSNGPSALLSGPDAWGVPCCRRPGHRQPESLRPGGTQRVPEAGSGGTISNVAVSLIGANNLAAGLVQSEVELALAAGVFPWVYASARSIPLRRKS